MSSNSAVQMDQVVSAPVLTRESHDIRRRVQLIENVTKEADALDKHDIPPEERYAPLSRCDF